jgi:hypothetical protein
MFLAANVGNRTLGDSKRPRIAHRCPGRTSERTAFSSASERGRQRLQKRDPRERSEQSNDVRAASNKTVHRTRRTVWRICQTRLRTDSSVASVAVRLTVFKQLHKAATSCTHICAHSVDICVEARAVPIPRVPTRQREGADNSRALLRVSGSTSDARRLRSHQ